jgi:uncharacterized protein YdeI (YjbR/CyaY-like superfamily)
LFGVVRRRSASSALGSAWTLDASPVSPRPTAFRSSADLSKWLAKHHATGRELVARCFKAHARDRGIGYREFLDEALCWGWIDGIRRALDADSFTVRFTPRRPRSFWSAVNIARFRKLQADGRIRPPGLAAFAARRRYPARLGLDADLPLAPALRRRFRAHKAAWTFFSTQAPWYQRLCRRFIMSAARAATREKRFALVLQCSARGRRIPLPGDR